MPVVTIQPQLKNRLKELQSCAGIQRQQLQLCQQKLAEKQQEKQVLHERGLLFRGHEEASQLIAERDACNNDRDLILLKLSTQQVNYNVEFRLAQLDVQHSKGVTQFQTAMTQLKEEEVGIQQDLFGMHKQNDEAMNSKVQQLEELVQLKQNQLQEVVERVTANTRMLRNQAQELEKKKKQHQAAQVMQHEHKNEQMRKTSKGLRSSQRRLVKLMQQLIVQEIKADILTRCAASIRPRPDERSKKKSIYISPEVLGYLDALACQRFQLVNDTSSATEGVNPLTGKLQRLRKLQEDFFPTEPVEALPSMACAKAEARLEQLQRDVELLGTVRPGKIDHTSSDLDKRRKLVENHEQSLCETIRYTERYTGQYKNTNIKTVLVQMRDEAHRLMAEIDHTTKKVIDRQIAAMTVKAVSDALDDGTTATGAQSSSKIIHDPPQVTVLQQRCISLQHSIDDDKLLLQSKKQEIEESQKELDGLLAQQLGTTQLSPSIALLMKEPDGTAKDATRLQQELYNINAKRKILESEESARMKHYESKHHLLTMKLLKEQQQHSLNDSVGSAQSLNSPSSTTFNDETKERINNFKSLLRDCERLEKRIHDVNKLLNEPQYQPHRGASSPPTATLFGTTYTNKNATDLSIQSLDDDIQECKTNIVDTQAALAKTEKEIVDIKAVLLSKKMAEDEEEQDELNFLEDARRQMEQVQQKMPGLLVTPIPPPRVMATVSAGLV